MKTKLISSEVKKDFIPFKVELEVESIEEARLLFHVFNHLQLFKVIRETPGYKSHFDDGSYTTKVALNLGEDENDINVFEAQILNQGYEI